MSLPAFFTIAALAENRKPLKVYYPVGEFELINSKGQKFGSKDLAKKFWVLHLFFTSCEGPCPLTTARVSKLSEKYKNEPKILFVSLTVDPDTDSLARISGYKAGVKADTTNWHFVRAEKEELRKLLTERFHIATPVDPTVHSTSLVLVDNLGQIRGYYSGISDEDLKRLSEDINYLLNLDDQ